MAPPAATTRGRGDQGNVSLFVVLLVPALYLAAGLVLDGGRQIQTRREAHGHAAAAARAAVQLGDDEVRHGVLDPGAAVARAATELSRSGASGQTHVAGQTVTVTVTAGVDYLLLPGSGTVSQTSSATPVQGVSGGSP